uniref:Uncharacterized protein n=1 Tax=Anguilla anguilla TaxID=7936 RepID=A0A0E9QWM3_ANGAN
MDITTCFCCRSCRNQYGAQCTAPLNFHIGHNGETHAFFYQTKRLTVIL